MRQQINLHLLLLLLLLLLLSPCRGQRSNPDRPSCGACDPQLSCNCSHAGFTCVPTVTDGALSLDLSCNDITAVDAGDLAGHRRLRALSLHGNRLAEIHPSAFDPLWSLQDLDLSDNQLTALSHRWFGQLAALRRLNLLNNPYRSCSEGAEERRSVRGDSPGGADRARQQPDQVRVRRSGRRLAAGSRLPEPPRAVFHQHDVGVGRARRRVVPRDAADRQRPPSDRLSVRSGPQSVSRQEDQVLDPSQPLCVRRGHRSPAGGDGRRAAHLPFSGQRNTDGTGQVGTSQPDGSQEHRRVPGARRRGAERLRVCVVSAAGISAAVSEEGVRHKRQGFCDALRDVPPAEEPAVPGPVRQPADRPDAEGVAVLRRRLAEGPAGVKRQRKRSEVFVHGEPPGDQTLQTDPPGCEQERVQLHAPRLLLALHPAVPQHLRGQTHQHQPVSAPESGGVGPELQRSADLPPGPAFAQRAPPLWEQVPPAAAWMVVPQPANTDNTVEHLEHVRPFGPRLLQAAPEPPGGSEQIRLLLRLCRLLPVGRRRRRRRASDGPGGQLHLRLPPRPGGGAGGPSPARRGRVPPGPGGVAELRGGAAARRPAVRPAVAPPRRLVPEDDVGVATGQAQLPPPPAPPPSSRGRVRLGGLAVLRRLRVVQRERRRLGGELPGARARGAAGQRRPAQRGPTFDPLPPQAGLPAWTLDCGQHHQRHGAQPEDHLRPLGELRAVGLVPLRAGLLPLPAAGRRRRRRRRHPGPAGAAGQGRRPPTLLQAAQTDELHHLPGVASGRGEEPGVLEESPRSCEGRRRGGGLRDEGMKSCSREDVPDKNNKRHYSEKKRAEDEF